MIVPKKRTPKGRRNRRRSHHALKGVQVQACPSCAAPAKPHRACPSCGQYKGRDVMKGTNERASKLEARKRQRNAEAAQDAAPQDA